MAPARGAVGAEKKGRKKKSKSRTQIEISSSESEGDTPQQSSKKSSKASAVPSKNQQNGDIPMTDAHDAPTSSPCTSPSPATSAPTPLKFKTTQNDPEEFSSIYLKKVTAELADDLVKVRDAQDFKASSLPMLVHALRQGSSIYSAEEKKRIVNATG
ncbi:uncharacterized protein N0V89_009749 [Didymosphaeria variabile]|uniref:Ribosome assembly protein 3 n=1 Tax=Didymosphaeria variabile TaxID=1932322 RepID=A0A9W9C7X9_9PLEO|nr:uncharacterized protein N0V89_009749 [Didymosphaeria variabile]KAJ4348375.1 hypothetical protein N0V89_009749 [Didymosphaeria variabile]